MSTWLVRAVHDFFSINNKTIEILLNQSTHIIPSREEILGIFRSAKAPLDLRALALSLDVKAESHAVLTRRLNAMERDGQIVSDHNGFFALADHSGFVAGRVQSHRDGFGFVIPDEPGEDLFLSEREMAKVLHGDKVLAKVVGLDRRGRPEGTIVEVVQRANTHIIGRLLKENGVWRPKTSASRRTSSCKARWAKPRWTRSSPSS
jgi:ribonuclease R